MCNLTLKIRDLEEQTVIFRTRLAVIHALVSAALHQREFDELFLEPEKKHGSTLLQVTTSRQSTEETKLWHTGKQVPQQAPQNPVLI